MGKIYEGDVGIRFRLDTKQDLTDATLLAINFKDPNEGEFTRTAVATLVSPATLPMVVEYITTLSDPALVPGDYYMQASAEWGPQSAHLGETYKITVYSKFE